MENDSAILALFDQIGQVLGPEGRVSAQQCVCNDAHGPHVHGLAVPLFEHDFGRGISKGARHGGENLVLGVKHLGNAKVGEHERRVGVLGEVEEVLRLEIWRDQCLYVGMLRTSLLTSVDDIVVVEVVDGIEHLPNRLGSVLLCELALVANAVKQLAARCQLGHNVIFVLPPSARTTGGRSAAPTLDSNQSWNLTMCGWRMRWSISSSS